MLLTIYLLFNTDRYRLPAGSKIYTRRRAISQAGCQFSYSHYSRCKMPHDSRRNDINTLANTVIPQAGYESMFAGPQC